MAIGSTVMAQNVTPKQVHKLDRKRVKAGVKSGELTKPEVKDIRSDNRELKADVRNAKADDQVTRAEKRNIVKDEAKLSRNIYVKKHNSRTRG
ncbi:hypothetical protein EZ449_00430 [Pedobacter frigidisoli]|uniref:Uncharacterized protein n=2 Tax=Pedobacter frigidisoli TaxID=2530455 RepID=A0A4R0P7J5_9SPHI|nr:hypothetical protein EZ449_00430 [Pedobacter frigidisoli]